MRCFEDMQINDCMVCPPVLEDTLTLRRATVRYSKERREQLSNSQTPELYASINRGSFITMQIFDNPCGHIIRKDDTHMMISLEPQILPIKDLSNILLSFTREDTYWTSGITGITSRHNNTWHFNSQSVPSDVSICLDKLNSLNYTPLSVYTRHALTESSIAGRSHYSDIYHEVKDSALCTGLAGVLHNNQLVRMNVDEDTDTDVKSIFSESESFQSPPEYKGFLCAGHTPHSKEAGKVRKVCHRVDVRLMTKSCITSLVSILRGLKSTKVSDSSYLLHCMGIFTYIDDIDDLIDKLTNNARDDYCVPSFHIDKSLRIISISISSGVLMRKSDSDIYCDNIMIYNSKIYDNSLFYLSPSLVNYFSTYFSLISFIHRDRPPRTLLASNQIVQTNCYPALVSGSMISPIYYQSMFIYTELAYQAVANEREVVKNTTIFTGVDGQLPGMNVMLGLANFNDNYEDCIIMSESSVERGLFQYQSRTSHNIPSSAEKIPVEGEYINSKKYRWWKANVDGKVLRCIKQKSGDYHIDVIRICKPVDGDKYCTQHGQKGVIKIWPSEDMPWIIDRYGEHVPLDMIQAISSLTNRITPGQVFEMTVSSMQCEQDSRSSKCVININTEVDEFYESEMYDGKTGEILVKYDEEKKEWREISVTWGICRVMQMIQMSHDKQHYSHKVASAKSARPPLGRTRGGGIRCGDLELQQMVSSGMIHISQELWDRKDMVVIQVCSICKRLIWMCHCDNPIYVNTKLPYSMVTTDVTLALTMEECYEYELEL